ncbi:MAG: sulfite exporter TauE/SafE family protein [Gammaproteobacteria bacterium]|nr:sulfite exporter TauE/SafE family protein [Gammaproteobacteria bacterium]
MGALLWPAAIGIGVVLGMFGAGGGMITVPALIYLGDMSLKQAVAMSLWVVALVSFAAMLQQKIWRKLQIKLLVTLGVSGMIGSVAGAALAQRLSEQVQSGLFAVLIFLVAGWLAKVELANRVEIFRFIPATLIGLLIGILTGILGVGGGFLLVPALLYLGISHFPTAVANSLVLITLNASAGGVAYLGQSTVSLASVLLFSGVAALGTLVGGYLLRRLPNDQLQRSFNLMLLLLGTLMAWRTVSGA